MHTHTHTYAERVKCAAEQAADIDALMMFCRNAYLSASKRFVEKDLEVSVAGRSFMITGANSGIGRATAMAIAKKGTTPMSVLFIPCI